MFVVIYIPDFALQAVLRQESEPGPVALVEEESARTKILQLTEAARAAGVREGMTSTQAMARCGNIRIRSRSIPAERIAQDALLQCAGSLSPFIEDTAPGICTIQNQKSEIRNLKSEIEHLAALHLDARIGVAETPDLALLAAHRADPILIVERSRDFLAALPVSALDPPPEISGILEKWGIRALGEFTALGKDALAARLGPEAIHLFDRATGNVRRPLRLVPPPEIFEETIEFEHEIETLEPLLFVLRRFLEQLTVRLKSVYLVTSELTLRLTFSNHPPLENSYERLFKIPEPTCDIDTLFRMLHTHLENFTADSPVVALHLAATPCRPVRQQFGLFETALRYRNRFHETLARLTALLGNDRAGTPQNIDTHRPDSFRMVPFTAKSAVPPSSFILHPSSLRVRRFRPPIPLEPSLRETARTALGPYLSSGDWWDAQSWGREEWDVQLQDGTLCRIYQAQDKWFLEGVYD